VSQSHQRRGAKRAPFAAVLLCVSLAACGGGGGGGGALPPAGNPGGTQLPGATPAPVPGTSASPTPKPTATPGGGATPKPTATPGGGETPKPTATPGGGATPKPTATPAPGGGTPAPTATPKASATPKPTATPAPTSTPSSSTSAANLVNGKPWPAGFRAYSASSAWNRPLPNPDSPKLMANSAAMVASAYAGGPGTPIIRTTEPGPYDYSHPLFYAKASDPLVKTQCVEYCNGITPLGQIHVPAKARPAQGGDHHMGIVQPDGTEMDFWEAGQNTSNGGSVGRDWQSGDTLEYGSGGACSNFLRGSGFAAPGSGYNPTAGGACLGAGRINSTELAAGTINHATFAIVACVANGISVAPATSSVSGSTGFSGTCAGNAANHIPLGARIWSDLTDAQVRAMNLTQTETAYLIALHHYGAFVMDMGGCVQQAQCSSEGPLVGFNTLDPPEEGWAYGNTPAGNSYAAAHGWNPVNVSGGDTPRYVFAGPWDPAGINFAQHLHIVDPCYAAGTC